MEDDGFKYDGVAVYDQQEHKCVRIYGDYPDEKAHAQVRTSAELEQQEREHFIDHFYVAEDIQKRGALDIKEYSSFDDALRAYYALPDTQRKALGAMNTRDLPGESGLRTVCRWQGHHHSGLCQGGRMAECRSHGHYRSA